MAELLRLAVESLVSLHELIETARALDSHTTKLREAVVMCKSVVEELDDKTIVSQSVLVTLEQLKNLCADVSAKLVKYQKEGGVSKLKAKVKANKRRDKMDGFAEQLRTKLSDLQTIMSISDGQDKFAAAKHLSKDDARKFWTHQFGNDNYDVPWTRFMDSFNKFMRTELNVTSDIAPLGDVLKYIVDRNKEEKASVINFEALLSWFGPLRQCAYKCADTFQQQWFQGFMSGGQAENMLRGKPDGTFIARFSGTKPGMFAIDYVEEGRVKHSRVFQRDGTLSLHKEFDGAVHATLSELIFANDALFLDGLPRLEWLHVPCVDVNLWGEGGGEGGAAATAGAPEAAPGVEYANE